MGDAPLLITLRATTIEISTRFLKEAYPVYSGSSICGRGVGPDRVAPFLELSRLLRSQ